MLSKFYGLEFETSADVFRPYATTELIVKRAIEILSEKNAPRFCDVGTGCGNIAVTLLKQFPLAHGVGLDVSNSALALAKINAEIHHVFDRLELMESNCLDGASGDFDLIVCNLPYMPKEWADRMIGCFSESQRGWVTDEADGLKLIRRTVETAAGFLRLGGFLLIEYTQSLMSEIVAMFDSHWGVEVLAFGDNRPLGILATKRKKELKWPLNAQVE